jgi:uncharacterized protein (DUF1697 family)
MPRYAAFLRGINIGNRRVKAADLCAPFESAGLEEVAAFRASGNVIFDGPREPAPKLSGRLEEALEESLGYDVAVFLRTAKEVRAIAGHEPFPAADVRASEGKLQISFLRRAPSAKVRSEVVALATPRDGLAFAGRELYWLPSGPMSDTELDLRAIDKLIGVSTRRTMGTVREIAAKWF